MIGSDKPLPIQGENVATLSSRAMDLLESGLERVCEQLRVYARRLCKKAEEEELPPLRKVNHRIPIIDESKSYGFRPSKLPEAFRELWTKK